jgi:RNA polymerase sigma-54 factor
MASIGLNLSHRLVQSQTLALTPAMQLKLKLWQMNLLELSQTIERELEENPLLELVEDGDDVPSLQALEEGHDSDILDGDASPAAEGVELSEGVDTVDLGPLNETPAEMNPENLEAFTEEGISQVQETEMGAENSWDADIPRTSNLPDDERMSWEDRLTSSETIQEHLLAQLYEIMEPDDPRALVLEQIIDHIDPKGFLRVDPDIPTETTFAEFSKEMGLTEEAFRPLLEMLQEFDPSGVGCFSVKESLLLQLRHAGAEPDDLSVRIIKDHSELLSLRDNGKLRKAIGCSDEELCEALTILRHLHPAPGRAFDPDGERVIKPDVVVLKGEDGAWQVYLNDEGVPRLKVNSGYRNFLASTESKNEKAFIRDRYRSARDFIRGVEDRNRTVLRVAASIVELQQDFLEHGIERLRPMVLRDVADATGFHESTISRVVKAKTIHTPQGLFDLNYFFSASLGSSNGDDVSATVVKHKIKALVQAEDPAKPLSDETIARLLERDGVKVARRTINKYREELKIPPASRRRRR